MSISVTPTSSPISRRSGGPVGWIEHPGGIVRIGHDGNGFAFDCEGPRHDALLVPHAIADRTVTNGEWAAFIADGGYARADEVFTVPDAYRARD